MNPQARPAAPEHTVPDALDSTTIDLALDALFSTTPAQYVVAVAENGLCVAMPPDVPVAPEQVIAGVTTPLDIFIAADLALAVEAWERVRRTKGTQFKVHLRSDPEHPALVHLVDARKRYGVFLLFVGASRAVINAADAEATEFRPRFCTMGLTELGTIRESDDAASKILGWTRAEMIGMPIVDMIHPDDRAAAIARWMKSLSRPGSYQRLNSRYRDRDGKYIWFEITNHNLLNDPEYGSVRSEMFDISERTEAAEALRASEQLLRRLTEALPLGIVQIDTARRIMYRNARLSDIISIGEAGAIEEQFADVAAANRPALDAALAALLGVGAPADIELTVLRAGEQRRCSVGMRALTAQSGAVSGGILCVTDITERVRMRDELEIRVKYDDLTHCRNRASILQALETLLQSPQREGMGIAVLFIDLDHFKDVNDRYGHAAGDELLRRIGQRLIHSVRTGDIVGRVGGDEFLIVCPLIESPELALDMASRAMAAIGKRIMLATGSIVPAASIGVAWTNRPIGIDALIAGADSAMYQSKRGNHQPILCSALQIAHAQ